jgi:putative membrane protein
MNTNTESKHTVEQDNTRFPKLIASSAAATLGLGLVAVGLLLAAPCAKAETKVCTADKDFILAAAQCGMTEVKLGELAAQKGTRDDVKAFGQMMVKDHTAINDDLKALATQKGVTLPDSLDAKHQGTVDKMAALTGSEFDAAYVADMVKDHKMDAKKFKAESGKTKDAEVKSFVDKSIPVVAEHLQRITAMKKLTSNAATEPDNTALNVRDRNDSTLTPLAQGNSKSDLDTSAQIRKEIIAGKDMSVNAKNVKIITIDGHVTLRGPVNTAEEKRLIGEIADRIAHSENVDNQLEVKFTTSSND